MGPMYARFAILMHEAAHKLLFTDKRANDWVGTWLLAYPTWTPISIYRRGHFAHHKEEFGPREPDLAFYGGYRCDRRTLARRLVRDAVGISGWKNFTPLFKALRSAGHPPGGRLHPRRAGAPVGRACGRPPAAGGSTRCCGGSRG